LFLSGVCHQFPEHSIIVAGVQLPLCARCTGLYLGALFSLGFIWAKGRTHAGNLPSPLVLGLLLMFFVSWAVDGLNSYYHYLTSVVLLYPPSNQLRLLTGLGNGLTLASLIAPLFSSTVWREPEMKPVLNGLGEVVALVACLLGVVVAMRVQSVAAAYIWALLSLLSVVVLLALLNMLMVLLVTRRENRAVRPVQVLSVMSVGAVLAICEVGGIALARHVVTRAIPLAGLWLGLG